MERKRFKIFDRDELRLLPLDERVHDLDVKCVRSLEECEVDLEGMDSVANAVVKAVSKQRAVVLMMGAHVIRSGVQRYIIDLMERGYISCIAMNGAGVIHDFEFSQIGKTTESVKKYISNGQFGLWHETGKINDIINQGYKDGFGIGESVGKEIYEGDYSHKDISLLAAGYRLNIPITVHVSIGCDIIHEHPNCDGAATGGATYRDFLILTEVMKKLEGGVMMNFGSQVMAPEVYLKALAMVRNVAHQKNESICHFTTLVCDLITLPQDISTEVPKDDPAYYFRPWKTMLIRTVADGGKSFYIRGDHATTIPQLWTSVKESIDIANKT